MPHDNGSHEVIMPALGMAQDSGLIVAWHKAPGDAVAAEDVLFEVETDKSTMEVEAGADGYIAALLAEAGEEAPVGETIAVITADKPVTTVQKSRATGQNPKPQAPEAQGPEAMTPAKAEEPPAAAPRPTPVAPGGRILASPKARRLALEQGLDLTDLVAAGRPQPYHVADLSVLALRPAAAPAPSAPRRLTAALPDEGFTDFAAWAAETAGLADAAALLAGLAAASLSKANLGRDRVIVAFESPGLARAFDAPAGPLSAVTEAASDACPDLHLRDLRMSRVASIDLGAEDTPVLTLTRSGTGLTITLECASHHLSATDAVALLTEFAGRMEQPLRHLL